ncbi:MAG: DUF3794 domain-containing protein [Clostridiaceae bacterium]|nr:DUF3794 domain-containing protein [Clostridiaceae bacterium]
MELIRDTFRYRRLTAEAYTTQEEAAEAVVADALPDAARVVDTVATVTVRDRLPREGAAEIRASVRVYVLCIEEGTERLMRVAVPLSFTHKVELPGLATDAELMCDAVLLNADARLLNPRKLSVRAELRFHTRAYTDAEELVTRELQGDTSMQTQQISLPVCATAQTGTKTFTVIEELPIASIDFAEPLTQTATLVLESAKCGPGRVTLQGHANVRVLYNDSAVLVRAYRAEVPFEQVAEFPGVTAEMRCDAVIGLKSTEIEPATDVGGQKVLTVSLGIHAETAFYETRTVTLLSDAYSTTYETEITTASFSYEYPSEPWKESVAVDEKIETASPVGRVIDWQLTVPGGIEVEPGSAQFRVLLRALYAGDDGMLYGIVRRIPVAVSTPPCDTQDVRASISDADVTGGEVLMVRFTLTVICTHGEEKTADMVTSAETGDEIVRDPDVALILRFVTDESLWALAKAYHASQETIRSLNGLPEDEDTLDAGAVLIPSVQ